MYKKHVQIFQEIYYVEINQPARKLEFQNDLKPQS